MNGTCLCSRFLGILGISALLIAAGLVQGQPPDRRLEKIFSDWKTRQDRSHSARYLLSGEKVVSKIWSLDKRHLPQISDLPRDVKSSFQRLFIADWNGGRYRLENDEQEYDADTDKLYPQVTIRAFDGTFVKGFRPRDRNTHPLTGLKPNDAEKGIGSGWMGGAALEAIYWPPFFGHGVVPSRLTGLKAGTLKVLPDIELMVVHGQAVHRGRACLVLRTRILAASQSFDEFWVDQARDSAVVRYLLYSGGRPSCELDMEYQTTSRGWLPARWTFYTYDPQFGKIMGLERVQVKELTVDLPLADADFDIEEKPGMRVQVGVYQAPDKKGVWSKPKTKMFLVGEDGIRREIFDDTERVWGHLWWWVVPIVGLAGLSAWLIYRRKRRSRLVRS